jgi:hypothetical protein
MTAPLLTKAWTPTPNVRNAYVSLNDMASWWFYNNHVAIKAKQTIKWTCDGVTGPANAGDATDRLTDKTKCATQAAIAGAAQSWAIYEGPDVQTKITYQGATADVLKISYSRSKGFAIAGTANQEPTAADEVAFTGLTIVGSGTSLDRVMSIWVRDDGRGWSCATFRSGVITSVVGVEQVTSLATVRAVNPIFDVPYCNYHYLTCARGLGQGTPIGGINASPSTTVGTQIRCYTDTARTIGIGGGEIAVGATAGNAMAIASSFVADKPAAQDGAASPMLPIYWSGARNANVDGFFASPIDWWQCCTSGTGTPAIGDPFSGYDPGDDTNGAPRANWLVSLGSAMIRPWRNVAAGMSTS